MRFGGAVVRRHSGALCSSPRSLGLCIVGVGVAAPRRAMQQRSAATARAGPRWIHLSLACLATFALTRLLDRFGAAPPRASSAGLEPAAAAAPHASAFAAARRLRRDEALAPRADQPPVTAAAATPTAAPLAVPSGDGRRAGAGKFAPPATPAGGYFIVIGFPIGIDERNRDRRALLRELWYPEYDNIGKTVRVEFVIGLLTYQGDGHEDAHRSLGLNAWLDDAVVVVCCCAWL